MCLYPHRILNQKYLPNAKNDGLPPAPPRAEDGEVDGRVLYVDVPCGNCIECRKKKAREWQVRLNEEIKVHKYNYFVTLTFSNQSLRELMDKYNLKECNAVAGKAVRHCHELWRKYNKKQLKHWYITELGHQNTERIHLHGLIFSDEPLEFTPSEQDHMFYWKYWRYGHVYVGDYVSNRTINYIVKYVTKLDSDHQQFKAEIFCSPGIGKVYTESDVFRLHKYRPRNTLDFYRLNNGSRVAQPTYYRNKNYDEDERELLWRETMDKGNRSVLGVEYDCQLPEKIYREIIQKAQEVSKSLGYGDRSKNYLKRDYNITYRMLRRAERDLEIEKKLQEICTCEK